VGEKIQTIVNERQHKGTYQYTFSVKDIGFAPGVYILRLKSDSNINSSILVELQ